MGGFLDRLKKLMIMKKLACTAISSFYSGGKEGYLNYLEGNFSKATLKAMEMGREFHTFVLEPHKMEHEPCNKVMDMQQALQAYTPFHDFCGYKFKETKKEIKLKFKYKNYVISCVLDMIFATSNLIVITDLKSTSNVTDYTLNKSISEYGYHVQLAIYKEAFKLNFPHLANIPIICALQFVSKESEPKCRLWVMHDDDLELGKEIFDKALIGIDNLDLLSTDGNEYKNGVPVANRLDAWTNKKGERFITQMENLI